jgi:hypothetical protein
MTEVPSYSWLSKYLVSMHAAMFFTTIGFGGFRIKVDISHLLKHHLD